MNFKVIARPNSAAVFTALGVYLDVMRPFVVQNLPVQLGNTKASTLLRDALPEEMRGDFDNRWAQCNGDESLMIDVTHIPHIVRKNWDLSFAREFKGHQSYVAKMVTLAKYRNMVCHPSGADVSLSQAEKAFQCVEKITTQIDRVDACEQVSSIRQRLKDGCCSDCPESHMRIETDGQEEVEQEMRRMQSELAALSQELSSIRAKPIRSRRSAFASRLSRVVPRVSLRFSVSLGDAPSPLSEDSTGAVAQDDAKLTAEPSSLNGQTDGGIGEQQSTDNGHSERKVRRGLLGLTRARKR